MWSTSPPAMTVRDTISACSGGDQTDLVKRLLAAEEEISGKSLGFQDAAKSGACWTLQGDDFQVTGVSPREMVKVYTYNLVRGSGRPLYDEIMSRAALQRCPLCDHGLPSTLDHFLPKSEFSALAIDPWNLVPVCKDCNYSLLADKAKSAETEHIHPFVWVDGEGWLAGSVAHLDPPFVEFRVSCPESWPQHQEDRVRNHFERLKLASRYAAISATGVQEVTQGLRSLLTLGSPNSVEDHLAEQADGLADRFGNNYWRTVMLRALAEDPWYWREWVWS